MRSRSRRMPRAVRSPEDPLEPRSAVRTSMRSIEGNPLGGPPGASVRAGEACGTSPLGWSWSICGVTRRMATSRRFSSSASSWATLSMACSMIVTSGRTFEYASATSRLVASSKMWAIRTRFPSDRCCILLGESEQLPRVAEECFAPGREGDMTAVAHEETRAELILELADLLRKCRLADVELVRRPAEVKLIGHHYEVAHQAQVEVHAYPQGTPGCRTGDTPPDRSSVPPTSIMSEWLSIQVE